MRSSSCPGDALRYEWTKLATNFEAELTFMVLAFHLATVGVIYSYGAQHRTPVWRNGTVLVVFLLAVSLLGALLFTERTAFTCLCASAKRARSQLLGPTDGSRAHVESECGSTLRSPRQPTASAA